MSAVLPPSRDDRSGHRWRALSREERELASWLIRDLPRKAELREQLTTAVVEDMKDGGMGSIRFRRSDGTIGTFGVEAAEVEYTDADGVLVSITVNLDEQGNLFELDFWKTDFSELVQYPSPNDVRTISKHSG